MKRTASWTLSALLCTGMIACGGSSGSSSDDLSSQAPGYDLVALSVADSDSAAPGATSVDASDELTAQPADSDAGTAGGGELCHPHLFARTRQVVLNLNILSYKVMSHVADVIGNAKGITVGETETWEHENAAGVQRKFTLTKTAPGAFTFELDMAAAGSTSFVDVYSGNLTRTAAVAADAGVTAAPAEVTGSMTFDYTAFSSVITSNTESGQIAYQFTRIDDPTKPGAGVKKTATVTFTNFKFGPNDPHGARNGSYGYVGEPGNGGTLSYQDSIALLCPDNPSGLDANTVTEARWFIDASAAIHGRADATATGGQIAQADLWEGVTCHTGPAPTILNENGYWMMKLEDGSGNTIQGSAHEVADPSAVPACDPAFGAVPLLTADTNDWTFGNPLTFPGEW